MATNNTKKDTAASRKTGSRSGSGSGTKTTAKTTTKKTSSTRRTTAKSETQTPQAVRTPAPAREQTNPMIMKEAVLWLILAVCILFFISYLGLGGYLGDVISDFSFGIFGISAYIFPFLAFLSAAFLISNRGSHVAGIKVVSAVGCYLCICSFASLLLPGEPLLDISEMYNTCAAGKNGGGVIGGVICSLLRPALGDIGTCIILVILSIVFLVLITQRSLMRGMKNQSSRVYHSAKASSARRREAHQVRKERREETYSRRAMESPAPDAAEPILADPATARPLPENVTLFEPDSAARGASGSRRNSRKNASARNNTASRRTEIEVPVLFPAPSRMDRAQRRVRGVTTDTKLEGASESIGSEISQILPSSQNTSFIDLEEETARPAASAKKKKQEAPELTVYHEDLPLHIEGIETPEAQELDVDLEPVFSEEYLEKNVDEPDTVSTDLDRMTDDPSPGEETHGSRNDAALREGGTDGQGPDETAENEKTVQGDHASSKRNPRSSQQEIEDGIASVEEEAAKAAQVARPAYVYPPLDLLNKGKNKSNAGQEQEVRRTAAKLQQTLESFGVHATVTNVSCGPAVTRYELQPEQGVKVSRIVGLSDDIKLNLAASDIRIEAPIPGKAAVGIEVPNAENSAVSLRELLESDEFQNHPSKLAFATGKDIGGKVVVSDIAKMPHLLIAGATGSGKSVCINTLIMSILYKADPEEVKLIMVDPKVVELNVYNGIPHLLIPVVTDPKKAAGALNWAVAEMTDRYNKFAELGVRDLKGYNKKIEALDEVQDENKPKKLPQIVIIVDELADLMMVAPGEVEDAICRLAQLARACGIHLILATQRPSVNVITGLIKANMPSRIAFSVTSSVDSRTILDMGGAEKLLGKGDMLFYPQGYQKPARVQGAFVSDEEVSDVVDFLKNQYDHSAGYSAEVEEQIAKVQSAVAASRGETDTDPLFADAGKFIIEKDKASIGMLQRVFKIGFNRAARIMDQLSDAGVVGPEEGTKPRKILMSSEQFENYLEEN